jgi:aspartate carbamoyltransferase regulatory subunit
MVYAHRFAYEQFVGAIPEGQVIDHLCRNPGCCNPSHLEAVPHRLNIQRGRAATKTSCNYGHDWTDPKNVYYRKNGRRFCAQCSRERQLAAYHEGRR